MRKTQIIGVKLLQIVTVGQIARTNLTLTICHNGIHGNGIVLHQLIAHGKHIELLHPARRTAYAVTHKHIELKTLPTTYLNKA
jgi:hypothetical protein